MGPLNLNSPAFGTEGWDYRHTLTTSDFMITIRMNQWMDRQYCKNKISTFPLYYKLNPGHHTCSESILSLRCIPDPLKKNSIQYANNLLKESLSAFWFVCFGSFLWWIRRDRNSPASLRGLGPLCLAWPKGASGNRDFLVTSLKKRR